jgi:hypothetical protein
MLLVDERAQWEIRIGPGGITAAAQEEYDGFGPWIKEVKTLEDMPPRFRDCFAEHAGARFLLKQPRNEERRNLKPGMDLYPAVLAVHEDSVCLMAQAGAAIDVRRAALGDLQGIRVFQDLLHGQLELFLADGACFSFGYNASSQPLIDRVVDFLLQSPAAPAGRAGVEATGPVEVADLSFQTLLAEQARRHPQGRALHSEAAGRACRDRLGRRALSLGILVLGTDRDLVLISQGRATRRRKEGVYATETRYARWADLRSFGLAPGPLSKGAGWRTLRLQVGSHLWEMDLFEPDSLLAVLERCLPGAGGPVS